MAYCHRPGSVVCLSVGLSVTVVGPKPCKNGSTDQDAVWVEVSDGVQGTMYYTGSRSLMEMGNFEGEKYSWYHLSM